MIERNVAFVIDPQGSIGSGHNVDIVKAALGSFVQRRFVDSFSTVRVSDQPELVQPLTRSGSASVVAPLALEGHATVTALWDGLDVGLRTNRGASGHAPWRQANIVLITDGRDNGSSAHLARVRADAVASGTAVFTIAIESAHLDAAPLEDLAASSGGSYQVGPISQLERMLTVVGTTLHQQYQLNFMAKGKGPLDLEVRSGGLETAVFNVGLGKVTPDLHGYRDIPKAPAGWSFFENPASKAVIAALVLLAMGLALFAMLDPIGGRRASPPDRAAMRSEPFL